MTDIYEKQRRYSKKKTAAAADIGDVPDVVNTERREACRLDLHLFLQTYFPQSTGLSPLSDDHKRAVDRIQRCALNGGRFVQALPRGFGKTTISENAAIWAVLYGHRKFVAIFGADANSAAGNIDSIKLELSENDLLAEDFPEVCHAVRALEGKPQRCASQTHDGELTHIEWTAETLVLPTIKGSIASGAIVTCRGITAGARGMKHKRPDGTQQRPDFVILDDPQTDESASSPAQVSKRLEVIRKSILKLGGHKGQIAVVMNATVIQPDDMVDQLLNAKLNPSWQGERIAMVKKWADKHESHWLGEYARLRTTYDADRPGAQREAHERATAYYREHQAEMDAGASVTWPHCFDPATEASAIQHAYNLFIDDGPDVFASECQNQPVVKADQKAALTADILRKRSNGVKEGAVPLAFSTLTAFVDVQGKALYWAVCAFGEGFSGAVVDSGVFPEQPKRRVSLAEVKRTLARAYTGAGPEGALRAGLHDLMAMLSNREYEREDGAKLRISRGLVDSGWGEMADTVYEAVRSSPHSNIWMPSKGIGVTAASRPWEEYKLQPGEQGGSHWTIAPIKKQATRLVRFDTNYWKSFMHRRLTTALGDVGALSFCGGDFDHLIDHITAEYPIQTSGRGRTLEEWKCLPGRDNHWLDCLVGCAVAASIIGVRQMHAAPPAAKKKLTLSQMQRRAR